MSEFKDKVNELVGKMEQDDKGRWQLPEDAVEGIDEATLYAVTAERRYRDTQGAYTKSRQEIKRQEAIATGFQEKLLESKITLTKEQRFELNELKKTNPDAWRVKLNEYEEAGRTQLNSELDEIRTDSANKGELEVRKEQMAAWSESTGIELTDEIVASELPPRFMKDLEKGKITFEEFLDKAGTFLKAEKVIQGSGESTDDDTMHLGQVAGGKDPSKQAQEGDFVESYEKDTLF